MTKQNIFHCPFLEKLLFFLFTQYVILTVEKDKVKNEAELYLNRMNELMSYEEKCGVKEKEVHHLIKNILPDKERTICQLTVRVTELQGNIIDVKCL